MLQYTDFENYRKYIINKIYCSLKLNENVYESGVVNRYTWKYNKLHDPCQSEIYTDGLERRIRPYDRRNIVEGRPVIT